MDGRGNCFITSSDQAAHQSKSIFRGYPETVIILGIILLIVGFLLKIAILWLIGVVLLVIGLILLLLGALGHAVGSHRHYY